MINLTLQEFTKRFPQIGSALEPYELEAFIALLKVQFVEASESLIIEGTITDSLYLVWEGELDVIMQAPAGEHKVAVIEQGGLFGEISLLSPGKATATVRSELGCVALHLDVEGLQQFWAAHPHAASVFLRELSRLVAQRTHSADETLKELKQLRSQDTQTLKKAQSILLKGSR
jgi:CRP-like cAMP-binding protein